MGKGRSRPYCNELMVIEVPTCPIPATPATISVLDMPHFLVRPSITKPNQCSGESVWVAATINVEMSSLHNASSNMLNPPIMRATTFSDSWRQRQSNYHFPGSMHLPAGKHEVPWTPGLTVWNILLRAPAGYFCLSHRR